jgi:hypothetical protein
MRWKRLAQRLALPLNHLPVVTRGVPPWDPPTPYRCLQEHRTVTRASARDPLEVNVTVSYACFVCGDTGHIKANCPELHPPGDSAGGYAAGTPAPGGASYRPMEELRRTVPVEVTSELAERYGSQIRAAMGWGQEPREARLRALALAQVEESQRRRLVRDT